MLFSGRLYNNIAASLKEEYAFYTIQVHVVGLMIIIFYVSYIFASFIIPPLLLPLQNLGPTS